jgi:hypothetical protein
MHVYPENDSLAPETWRNVTFSDFAKAVNRTCAYLEPLIGRSTTFETQAFFGPPDMRYHLFLFACMKLGHKALFSAPRNSLPMHLHLLQATECTSIFHCKQVETLEEARWDPYLVLHTSGSTGMPKPIVHRHGWLTALDKHAHHPGVDGRPSSIALLGGDARRFMGFPPWHVSGAEMLCPVAQVFGELVWVWGPTNRMPSAQDVIDCCVNGKTNEIGLPAQLYADVSKREDGMAVLAKQKLALYGGGK